MPITDGAELFEREIRNAETEIKVFCRLCHTRVFSRHNITTLISSCGFVWYVLVVTVYIFQALINPLLVVMHLSK